MPPPVVKNLRLIFGRTSLRVGIPVLFIILPLIFGVVVSMIIDWRLEEIQYDYGRLMDTWAQMRLQVVGLVILNSVLGLLLGLGVVYILVRPVQKIQEIADQVSEGRFEARLDVDKARDEVGQMGRSFNTMVDSLHRMFSERNAYMMGRVSGAVFTIAFDGVIGSVNDSGSELMNMPEEELLGANFIKLLRRHPSNEPLCEALESCLSEERALFSHQATLTSMDDEIFPVSVSTTSLHGADGKPYNIVVNIQNLSVLRDFYRNMTRADRLAAIGTFAMGMAHEIRNPLGSIKGLTQLITQQDDLDETTKEYGQVILREVNRLDKLLGELLAFAEPVGQSLAPIEMALLVTQVHDMAWLKAQNLSDKVPPAILELDSKAVLSIPRDKVFQAILNIVQNAYEAVQSCIEHQTSPPEGVDPPEVRISLYDISPDVVRLTVINTGSTIEEGKREKIFEPFMTDKENGTGLGLAITYQTISYIGANIKLRTNDDFVAFDIDFPTQKGYLEAIRGPSM